VAPKMTILMTRFLWLRPPEGMFHPCGGADRE
jgi:hypothetical protein